MRSTLVFVWVLLTFPPPAPSCCLSKAPIYRNLTYSSTPDYIWTLLNFCFRNGTHRTVLLLVSHKILTISLTLRSSVFADYFTLEWLLCCNAWIRYYALCISYESGEIEGVETDVEAKLGAVTWARMEVIADTILPLLPLSFVTYHDFTDFRIALMVVWVASMGLGRALKWLMSFWYICFFQTI